MARDVAGFTLSGQSRHTSQYIVGAVMMLLLLSGCIGGGLPPVSDRSRVTSTAVGPTQYRVVSGDTLYSIAWRHQKDFRELAARNGIRPPYDIYPGQRLEVRWSARSAPAVRRPPARAPERVANTSKPHPLSRTQPKPQAQPQPQPRQSASTTAPTKKRSQQSATRPRTQAATTVVVPGLTGTGPVALRWPGKGTRLRSFGEQPEGQQKPNNSIDFLMQPGASIRTAAAGEVVYVGQALAGFEQFVIVKHNNTWLSAYGFNAASSVREKQLLASGAVLARLAGGASEKRNRELHFEVRKNGRPVNPALVIK